MAEERTSHGVPCFFVRKGKQFAACVGEHHGLALAVWVAAPPEVQAHLVASEPSRYFVPPYVGVRGWIGVWINDLTDWEALAGLVSGGHRHVAPPKLVAQIGP